MKQFILLLFLTTILAFILNPLSVSVSYAQTCTDVDGDGYGLNGDASCPNAGVDCDDDDANTYPDAPLLCDAKDNNCDGWIDFSTDKDVDEDGVPLCRHWQTGLKDCDDNNPNRYPGNVEGPFGDATCSDGIDNDCNNRTDSADNGCSVNCNDIDGDGYGSPGNVTCPNGSALDCNNTNAAINPGAADDVCNGVDNNCSGTPDDEYVDTPTNCGVGACASTGTLTCSGGVESDSCVEGTPAKEGASGHPTCTDTVDNDCDGATDASDVGCQGTCLDDDGDGYGFYGDVTCPNGSAIDCDDDNGQIHPAMTDDVCDGVDANCSGTADDDYTPTVTNCGVGECATTGLLICTAGATVDNCSPLAPGVEGPFGDPSCTDTLDNDCDGIVDAPDNDCNPLDQDNDGDGFCEVGPCQNPANLTGDCDDTDAMTYPGAPRICDAIDNDCDGWQDFYTDKDVDGDGVPLCTHWQTGLKDCDDNNANRFPGNIEGPFGDATCIDAIDNDCDNKTDTADEGCTGGYCVDNDGDGYGFFGDPTCPNGPAIDCNDDDPAINPGAAEVCDGIDNNCSGTADDSYVPTVTNCGVGACASTGTLTCSGGVESDSCTAGTPVIEGPLGDATCGDTSDNDCDGTTDALDTGCQSSCLDDDGDGYGLYGHASCINTGVDCDDSNALINPGGDDANCNGIDEDCDGTPDDEYDPPTTNCGVGECAATGPVECVAGATVDSCIPLVPGVEGPFGDPTCSDGLDNDCDGIIDNPSECSPTNLDGDGDGFCRVGPCQNPANLGGDCDDTDVYTYPGAPRLCDAVDNDCDGWQDFYTDKDVDGDGVPLCTHWQTGLKDCDDNNPDRFPGNIEVFGHPSCFDGIDNDCNYKIDIRDLKCTGPRDFDEDGYCIPGHPSCFNGGATDCDDGTAAINPGAADDTCDGVDNNCSGTADDQYAPTVTNCGVGACARTGTLTCVAGLEEDDCTPGDPVIEGPLGDGTCIDTFDNDCDTFEDALDPGCQSLCLDDDGDNYGLYGHASCPNAGVDCNDKDPNINPGAADDNCDTVDDNCSGTADDEYTPTVTNCGLGECVTTGLMNCNAGVLEDDCLPLPAGVEDYLTPLVCTDTLDNDCDGFTDTLDLDCDPPDVDNDGDGYCEVGPCQNPANLTGDCDDTDDIVHPGGNTTICDARDTNCDGWLDFFTDKDVDGDGVPLCEHWQTGLKDCDDNDPTRYPGNPEGPRDDPTCFDGFDNDCDNKTDNLDTDCAPPTCGTDPSPRDGPHMFDLLDGNDNVLKTPCQWCHFNDAGTVDERRKCERCHADPAWGGPDDGTLKVLYTDPPPYGFGTAQIVKKHSSTVLGTKYGAWDMDCVTCHNPHRQEQDNIHGTTYGKLIKEYICFDNTAIGGGDFEEIVEFTASSGAGSFADGPPVSENICEICHTLTNHHRRDDVPQGPGGPSHSDSKNCTNCHRHIDGFEPIVKPAWHHDTQPFLDNCDYCHVTPTDFITPVPDSKCNQCHTPDGVLKLQFPQEFSGAIDVIAHTDANGSGKYIYNNACIDCHEPMFDEATNLKLIRFSISKSIFPGSFIEFSSYSGPGSFADGPPHENNICETCHTLTNHHQADGTAPGGQSHNFESTCTDCHTHSSGFLPGAAGQGHDTHLSSIKGPQISCDTENLGCHGTNIPPMLDDNNDLTSTEVCDVCHSPGGSFDGVNDIDIGVKNNWTDGVYDGKVLKAGKEYWCAGCHDEAPSNSKIDGTGINAPNVIGDDLTYGFYISGHGNDIRVNCTNCHDASKKHIDHLYSSLEDVVRLTGNPTSYRFYDGKGMELPHSGVPPTTADDFQLCFTCHNETWYSDNTTASTQLETNFRLDDVLPVLYFDWGVQNGNLHWYHLYSVGSGFGAANCILCHNPHGTDRPIMGGVDMSSFSFLQNNGGIYYELVDPVPNAGGVITSAPVTCGTCHSHPSDIELAGGLTGPGEKERDGWYLRQYKPHTFAVNLDIDGDGLDDETDNCTNAANPGQTDIDDDGAGDACDNCLTIPNDQADIDKDGIGNACDPSCDTSVDVWRRQFGTSDADIGHSIAADNNDNIYIAGWSSGNFPGATPNYSWGADVFLRKYGPDGIEIWTEKAASALNSDIVSSIAIDNAGNIFVTGHTEGAFAGETNQGGFDVFLIKFMPDKTISWIREVGTTLDDKASGVAVDINDNILVLGSTEGSLCGTLNGTSDYFLMKFDQNGNTQCVDQYGSSVDDTVYDLAIDSTGNLYVTVGTYDTYPGITNAGDYDSFIIKYDQAGNRQWIMQIGTDGSDQARGIDIDANDNIYVAGTTSGTLPGQQQSSGFNELFLIKYNSSGNSQWIRQLGGTGAVTFVQKMTVDPVGNSFITGTTSHSFDGFVNLGASDVYVVKYLADGTYHWVKQWGGRGYDYANGIALDSAGDYYITGYTEYIFAPPSQGNYDAIFLKGTEDCP